MQYLTDTTIARNISRFEVEALHECVPCRSYMSMASNTNAVLSFSTSKPILTSDTEGYEQTLDLKTE